MAARTRWRTATSWLWVVSAAALGAAAKPAQQVPDGVAAKQLLLGGVVAVADGAGGPALQPGQLLVTCRQHARGDQHGAQVPERPAVGELVEGGVGERACPGPELTQDGSAGVLAVLAEPAQHGGGLVGADQVAIEGLQLRADLAGMVCEQLPEPLVHNAAVAWTGPVQPGGLTAARAGAPKRGIRPGADGAARLGAGAATHRLDLAAANTSSPALLAGLAPRLVGRRGDPARRLAAADRARHRLHRPTRRAQRPSGVRTLTGRRCAQPTQVSWLAGSVIRQYGHNGRPCSSRMAASRTTPHREQGSALDLATQLRHSRTPSRGLTSVIIRRQCGQGGRTTLVAPPSQSLSISRSTEGPAPQRRAGEQFGPVLQRPRELIALPGLGHRRVHRSDDDCGRQGRIDRRDDLHHDAHRVVAVVGRTPRASGLPMPVATVHPPGLPAARARLTPRAADTAVPVLAATLQGAQRLAALGADRRGDRRGARLAQRDQQITHDPRCRGAALREDRRGSASSVRRAAARVISTGAAAPVRQPGSNHHLRSRTSGGAHEDHPSHQRAPSAWFWSVPWARLERATYCLGGSCSIR